MTHPRVVAESSSGEVQRDDEPFLCLRGNTDNRGDILHCSFLLLDACGLKIAPMKIS